MKSLLAAFVAVSVLRFVWMPADTVTLAAHWGLLIALIFHPLKGAPHGAKPVHDR